MPTYNGTTYGGKERSVTIVTDVTTRGEVIASCYVPVDDEGNKNCLVSCSRETEKEALENISLDGRYNVRAGEQVSSEPRIDPRQIW